MEIRDPIHGFIKVDDYLQPFLALAVMHRARRIKQTGMTYLVYPGSNHTRFEHLLGCMHVAGRLANALVLDPDVIKTVKTAAILHDIGHGPFSHVSDQLFDQYTDEEVKNVLSYGIHEEITATLIRLDEGVGALVGDSAERIIELILKAKKRTVEHDIINGPFDADKLDYLLRDSHCAGVKYGIFDLERIVNTVRQISDGRESYMGVAEDGFWAVEQLVLAKRYMNLQVYRHRIRLITDAMFVRAIQNAVTEGVPGIKDLYSFSPTKEFVQEFLKWDDESVCRAIVEQSTGTSRDYIKRLRDRNLLKEVYSKDIRAFKGALVKNKISKLTPPDLREAEERIAQVLSRGLSNRTVQPEFVIVYLLTIDNPTFRPPGVEIRTNDIMILLRDGTTESADQYPGSIMGHATEEKEDYINVYAAMDGIDAEDRERIYGEVKGEITEIFEKL